MGKIQLVAVSHKRKLQVTPKSLTHTVQKAMAACRHLWEIQRRQEKSVSVLREQEWIVRSPVVKFPVESNKSVFASMWAVWWCNDGVRLCRQRSARRPRGKASTTWCHQRESRMTHQPQERGVQRNFNEINLQNKTRKQHSFSLKKEINLKKDMRQNTQLYYKKKTKLWKKKKKNAMSCRKQHIRPLPFFNQ